MFFSHLFKRANLKKSSEEKYRELTINNAKTMMAENYLSPSQIEAVISQNKDLDFLRDEAREMINHPDINYLVTRLLPQKIRRIGRAPYTAEEAIDAVIVGDIIGSSLEFTEHDYLQAETMQLPPRKSFHTDDTVLTKATYQAILDNPSEPDFRKAYIAAYKKEKGAGYGSAFVGWAEGADVDNTKGYHSYGNGCAMRIAPIAFYYDDILTMIHHTISSVMVTHDHVESVKAAIVLNVCVWMALHGYCKEDIIRYCQEHYGPVTDNYLYKSSYYDSTQPLPEVKATQPISRASLFANYAVPFAIRCFYETTDYLSCMRKILSYYGDTDTMCAIAASLCFAYYGNIGLNVEETLAMDRHKI